MRYFKGKTILIISPQEWSNMMISKHHYAIELKKKGNDVFFLNPNSKKANYGGCKLSFISKEGIKVLDYRPLFPMRFKFRFNFLYNLFNRYDVKKISKLVGKKIDIVWDFEPNRQFPDLNLFQADFKIYHPVDMTAFINASSKNSDIIISVSDVILNLFTSSTPKFFINHGLNNVFAEYAKKNINAESKSGGIINSGYFGNLRMPILNHSLIKELILKFSDNIFHFWGPYEKELHEVSDEKVDDFISFLKSAKNVILHGTKNSIELLNETQNIDIFFWALDNSKDPSKGSNSHKILEYLSLGRIIVGTKISKYEKEHKDLMVMANESEAYLYNYSKVKNNLQFYNSVELVMQRKVLALNNTYESQLRKIDHIVVDQLKLR